MDIVTDRLLQTQRRTEEWMDVETDIQRGAWMDGRADRQVDGLMEWWTKDLEMLSIKMTSWIKLFPIFICFSL